jgi:hypothetical protein
LQRGPSWQHFFFVVTREGLISGGGGEDEGIPTLPVGFPGRRVPSRQPAWAWTPVEAARPGGYRPAVRCVPLALALRRRWRAAWDSTPRGPGSGP